MRNRLELSLIGLGKPLVDWSLEPILSDRVPKKEDFLGKPLLILFFSLGCPGCLGRAIPYANRLVYERGMDMNVMGIHSNFDGVDFTRDRFQKSKEALFIRFPFFKDFNFDTTFLNYGAGGVPHWILVDKEGIVVYSIFGSEPNNALLRLEYMINELLIKEERGKDAKG